LLVAALKKSKQCALGRWTSRGKEHVVIIRAMDDGLALHQLHFKAEVRTMQDLGIEPTEVSEAEMTLATQLVQQLSAKRFDPAEYVDEFKMRVVSAIQRKVQGKQVSLAQAPERSSKGNVIDLMAALKASLNVRQTQPSDVKERKGPKRSTPAVVQKAPKRRGSSR
jgi:DNA end-binding protein Ku